ncbi:MULTISPECIES: hypothetical protein [unclassified Mesorhizobium]|uniref:hypothetical protein n=1 Tax=unclassified Mesorhizobium TaxID=325217 RepID=UPI0003CF3496|nr:MULTISPECIES: hypothetical protein [unclassified Mesorhizobium]ESY12764.1 hypothetical protein X751_29595 [Mesorhizobium sp. LNJC395A00]WJI74758.1 hypothetical protein NLY37_28115 [Mesorhizobium sp. C395A]
MESIDPAIGEWKLNLAKSKFINEPTPFSYKSATRTYTQNPDGTITGTVHAVLPDGSPFSEQLISKQDGEYYSHTGNSMMDTMSQERVNANTLVLTAKKADKVVGAGTRTVSSDGKVLTMTFIYVDAEGIMRGHVAAYDKQEG